MNRREFLASTTSTLTVASLAGCLDSLAGGDESTTTGPTYGSTDDDIVDTTNSDSGTDETEGPLAEEEQFDADHPIWVENFDTTAHTLTLRIRRDGAEVHSRTVEAGPGFDEIVYNLEQLQPEGIVQYQVVAEVGSSQDSRAVQTNACFGDVNVSISDGEPTVGFEIC